MFHVLAVGAENPPREDDCHKAELFPDRCVFCMQPPRAVWNSLSYSSFVFP